MKLCQVVGEIWLKQTSSKDAFEHPIQADDNGLENSIEGNDNDLNIDPNLIFLITPNISSLMKYIVYWIVNDWIYKSYLMCVFLLKKILLVLVTVEWDDLLKFKML